MSYLNEVQKVSDAHYVLPQIGNMRVDVHASRLPQVRTFRMEQQIFGLLLYTVFLYSVLRFEIMDIKTPRWEKFKAFFGIAVLRYLVVWFSLVPVIYSLLDGIPKPLPLDIAGQSFEIQLGLPFDWQLLWLSSFFYLVALFTYLATCPSFVKSYNTYLDYQNVGHDPRWLAWEAKELVLSKTGVAKFVDRLQRKGFIAKSNESLAKSNDNPCVEEKFTTYHFCDEGKHWSLSVPIIRNDAIVDGSERGIFWEIYGRYTESKPGLRSFIFGALITSGLLFLAVLAEHVVAGAIAVYEWLS